LSVASSSRPPGGSARLRTGGLIKC
jgi:hypothetical protein